MGSGIAESCARAGLDVVVHEPYADALERSRRRIGTSLDRALERGKLDADERAACLERSTGRPKASGSPPATS